MKHPELLNFRSAEVNSICLAIARAVGMAAWFRKIVLENQILKRLLI